VLEALREDKSVAQIASENQIQQWKKQALENFNQLFEEERQGVRAREAEQEQQLNELYAEIGRLSAQLSWLKKSLASNLSRAQRLAMLERDPPEVSLKVQAELLGISYSSLFYQPSFDPFSTLKSLIHLIGPVGSRL
jgi:putative transposase